jgi:GTP cyclohydrolase I
VRQSVTGIDQERIARAVREILAAIGEDPEREGLLDTPRRIAETYAEMFSGIGQDPRQLLRLFHRDSQELGPVVVREIPFYSLCEHHLLPFYGQAHVGYVPNGAIVGLSKIPRLIDVLARRPQVQERLTDQIAALLQEGLSADGVAVVVEAEHFCMTMRGVKKPGSRVITTAVRGPFARGVASRRELLGLVQGRPR